MKHNIGDLVQIKSRLWFERNKNKNDYNNYNFSYEMAAYCGKVLYVSRISDQYNHPYSLKMGDGTTLNYYWREEWIEDEVDPNNEVLMNSVNISRHCEVGDIVEINSKEWYNNNKNDSGCIETPISDFTYINSLYCGKRCKVIKLYYEDCGNITYNLQLLNSDSQTVDPINYIDTWADYMFKRVDVCTQTIDINTNLYNVIVGQNEIQDVLRDADKYNLTTLKYDELYMQKLHEAGKYDLTNYLNADTNSSLIYEPNLESSSAGQYELNLESSSAAQYELNLESSSAAQYELNLESPLINTNKIGTDKYVGKYVVINNAYKNDDIKMCNIYEHYFDNLGSMGNVRIDKKKSDNLYNITITFNVGMQQYVDEKLFVSKIEKGFYILKDKNGNIIPYLWDALWIDIDLYNEDIDPYKEYEVNDQVKVRSRYTIDNNKGKYYITPNCEFTTSMWKYCNNIYYIDEVIDFGLYDFKLYKLRNLEGNVLPYLWSNTWFYGIDNYVDEPTPEITFNKEKIILDF